MLVPDPRRPFATATTRLQSFSFRRVAGAGGILYEEYERIRLFVRCFVRRSRH